MGVMRMIVTFCGHSKMYQTGDFSKWPDIILPSLIEGGAATFYLGGYGDFGSLLACFSGLRYLLSLNCSGY
jgi:hypothetical protein